MVKHPSFRIERPRAMILDASRHGGGEDDGDDELVAEESAPAPTAAEEQRAIKAAEKKQIEAMARKETNNLRVWRIILMVLMLSTGAAVSVATFVYIKEQERSESLESYEQFTQTIRSASESHFADFWRAMTSMAQTVTVAGMSSALQDFPYIRVPLFELPGSHTRTFSGVELVTWNPFVTEAQRPLWSLFSESQKDWYDESIKLEQFAQVNAHNLIFDTNATFRNYIWRGDRNLDGVIEESPPGRTFAPIWQCSPAPYSISFLNYDMLEVAHVLDIIEAVKQTHSGLMSAIDPAYAVLPTTFTSGNDFQDDFHTKYSVDSSDGSSTHPHSLFVQPVFDGLDANHSKFVGLLTTNVAWDYFLSRLLPTGVSGITAVLWNTCGQAYTYVLDGRKSLFLGEGDLHDRNYDNTRSDVPMITYDDNVTASLPGHCIYSVSLYYSDDYRAADGSSLAIICATIVATIFAVMTGSFFMYDRFVQQRNRKIVGAAVNSNAFISTLFPTQVRKRLLEENDQQDDTTTQKVKKTAPEMAVDEHDHEEPKPLVSKSRPIADLYTETTILFADIAGFSAWSSVREPSQVFTFLETLFQAFDEIAKKRRVFKVETVGDCYVAVAGLPEAREDHAVVMARFAQECMHRMQTLSSALEVTFGPDTGDLAMRMGMHSGPVTAGVLRGDRSRFQLFGDTMNTASRMEGNGLRNKIHISQETADLLLAAGKTKWVTRREDVIYAKGKGEIQTFWLEIVTQGSDSSSQKDSNANDESNRASDDAPLVIKKRDAKSNRLIKWSEDVLLRLLKQIVIGRSARPLSVSERVRPNEDRYASKGDVFPLEEVKDVISFPRFMQARHHKDPESVSLDPIVVQQLRSFVNCISEIHRENPFHSFEHATHVAMSVMKLMSRILDPVDLKDKPVSADGKGKAEMLHNLTYGIASDPLAQFSCVLAALIHDIDHPGVSNTQLVQEQNELAFKYNSKSVAEQNSVNVAWNLLYQDEYKMLRNTIYETDGELIRFRQIMVNSVIATDLFDMNLKMSRVQRWERAFSPMALRLASNEMMNRKATIVIEHMLQASDISHTMQHWHIYRKWNEKFFMECYEAYLDNRAEKNPAEEWYEGEMAFFDFYVIPLAHKLKECEVFGVSGDEYLNYAVRNRQEWEKRGRDVVNEMVSRVKAKTSNHDE